MVSERLDNLATCIRDLREIAKKEPNTVIDTACSYLSLFLEKLCTHELPAERRDGIQMHREVIYPLYEYENFSEIIWAKIRADVQIDLEKFLTNFEKEAGFRPVTNAEADKLLHFSDIIRVSGLNPDDQLQFMGYRIYKKR